MAGGLTGGPRPPTLKVGGHILCLAQTVLRLSVSVTHLGRGQTAEPIELVYGWDNPALRFAPKFCYFVEGFDYSKVSTLLTISLDYW